MNKKEQIRGGRLIYFDNAATSWPKPPEVSKSVLEAIEKAGNPGRGAHESALWSSYKLYETREKIASLFCIREPLRVAFTLNATHALNAAISLCMGEIITTSMEHNSVLRPLAKRGFYNIIQADKKGRLDPERVIDAISGITGAVVMTHASNVTGIVNDIKAVGEACRKRGALLIVDAAQTAGVIDINVNEMNIDILCFTGHKGLFGLQGTGGIYVAPHVRQKPFIHGGSGSRSFDIKHPVDMPECFEAGTMNTHGIAALSAGVEFVQKVGVRNIEKHESRLREYFVRKVSDIPGVMVYDDSRCRHVGVVSITIPGADCSSIANHLSKRGIATRPGFHCAPLAHKTIGTEESGTVRFSFGYFNELEEIDYACDVLAEYIKEQI
jgi:cysteine desulfurase/selenocysteine lyase